MDCLRIGRGFEEGENVMGFNKEIDKKDLKIFGLGSVSPSAPLVLEDEKHVGFWCSHLLGECLYILIGRKKRVWK